MTAPYQFPPIFLQLTLDEAFCFAKLQLPEGLPPEWYSAVAKVNLAIKVARHVETGLPLSEPLWEEPAPEPEPSRMDNRPLAGRVRAPSRPLPTDTWNCVVDSPDNNPFLPRVLWTVDGFKGIMMLDPAIPEPKARGGDHG